MDTITKLMLNPLWELMPLFIVRWAARRKCGRILVDTTLYTLARADVLFKNTLERQKVWRG